MDDLHCPGCLAYFSVSAAGTPTWRCLSGIARMATSLTCIEQLTFVSQTLLPDNVMPYSAGWTAKSKSYTATMAARVRMFGDKATLSCNGPQSYLCPPFKSRDLMGMPSGTSQVTSHTLQDLWEGCQTFSEKRTCYM